MEQLRTELQGKVSEFQSKAGELPPRSPEQMENKINEIFADIDPEKSPRTYAVKSVGNNIIDIIDGLVRRRRHREGPEGPGQRQLTRLQPCRTVFTEMSEHGERRMACRSRVAEILMPPNGMRPRLPLSWPWGIRMVGPWGPVYGPLDPTIPVGGAAFWCPAGTPRDAPLPHHRRRMKPETGELTVSGCHARQRHLQALRVGRNRRASTPSPESVTVRDLITEQLRWDARGTASSGSPGRRT